MVALILLGGLSTTSVERCRTRRSRLGRERGHLSARFPRKITMLKDKL